MNQSETSVLHQVKPENASGAQPKLASLSDLINQHIVGQKQLIDSLLVCLLTGGHLLIEGMPGLAKTTAAKAIATGVEGQFHRIQFTPDLLPSDLIGTDIYTQESHTFTFKPGPIFQNILLADEINRAPAKVQSALLEAMEEKQVTVGAKTYPLPDLFLVVATQNPIEQEGTYPLPEAQLDRFLLNVFVNYPSHQDELEILNRNEKEINRSLLAPLPAELTSQQEIFAAQQAVKSIYVDERLKDYIVSLIQATRSPEKYDQALKNWIQYGASPRASLALLNCSKAYAWLKGEAYVSPEHIQAIAPLVLRHRIKISFEAEADELTVEQVIAKLLLLVAIP